MKPTYLLGVGTANPTHELHQQDARQFAQLMFGDAIDDLERLLPIFHNTRINRRTISQPLDWYGTTHTFQEANELYQQVGTSIAIDAAKQALERSGLAPDEIGSVLFVSSTGIATPSLDVAVIQALGLSPHVQRLPLWGLGCAGGVSGLARAAQLAQQTPDKAVLIVAMELCSLTFQRADLTKANLVAVSLFGDGAAALVLHATPPASDTPRLALYDGHSTLMPDTEYVMGWDLIDTGLQVRFDRSIPALVLEHLASLVENACTAWDISTDDVQHMVVHPGGAKVLAAYAESLGRDPALLRHAYDVLTQFGNMSSPTVFFVLDAFLQDTQPSEQLGTMLAWGPGFSAEQLLFRW
jgi:alkylresorcinol/alkylpyrone synthase